MEIILSIGLTSQSTLFHSVVYLLNFIKNDPKSKKEIKENKLFF